MTYNQLVQTAEELYDNPQEVLSEALQELVDRQGWSQYTTLKEAMQTHSKWLEQKITTYATSD